MKYVERRQNDHRLHPDMMCKDKATAQREERCQQTANAAKNWPCVSSAVSRVQGIRLRVSAGRDLTGTGRDLYGTVPEEPNSTYLGDSERT